ncbi:MAG: PD40 domain-containing protein, partial [Streptomyces sp.]|nr:PD40 domain-containing protein [Streptomyces sp.]
MTESSGGPSTFRDLSALVACPRVNSLALSVDGTRLVAAVQVLSGDGTRFVSGLWEIDPTGERDALRLTRSDKGESGPVFGPDGTLYFLSERAAADGDEGEGAALWALPPRGEAVVVARHPGGIAAVTVARNSGALCHTAGLLPGAADAEAHGKLRAARKDAKVTAILYEAGPTRAWDHDLGPAEPHTFVRAGVDAEPVVAGGQGIGLEDPGDAALSPDGTRVAYRRFVPGRVPDEHRTAVVVADAVSGEEALVVGDLE